MSHIEVIICLLLLFMAVPDLCRKLGRASLIYPVFILIGVLLGPLANDEVSTMLHAAGKVGFVLLLFEVGLEIDLPRLRELLAPLRFAGIWALVQYPVILGVGNLAGLRLVESLVAAAALTGCSVSMAYPGWKHYPSLAADERSLVLHVMILLEMLTIVLLSAETAALQAGLRWTILLKLAGIVAVVLLVARFALHLKRLFQMILERATHWRTHLLVLLVLVVCAVGERLGLSASKTAFFLGLFMSRAEHDGKGIEESMSPISQRFLIPIFFVSLGLQVEWAALISWTGLMGVGTAGLLLGVREILHRRWLNAGGDKRAFLLLCPNLTVVALAASVLLEQKASPAIVAWLLLVGFFMSLFSLLLLPRTGTAPEDRGTPIAASSASE
ncbi:MAG: cation:proton antiporter [Verrucomicrobia bacterium]|nr:cation:proton antiporter [Verrucomicrobiota bacterium]